MATHDYVIDNQSAPALRADLNLVLQAIVSNNASATAPSTTYANMLWYDTATNALNKRNEANSGWITIGTFDEGTGTFSAALAVDVGATQGDIIYRSATQWTRLPKGTVGQVLTQGASIPSWATVGGGQTWQDVKASRALATTYTNSTGKPIFVSVTVAWGNASASVTLTIDGVVVQKQAGNPDSSNISLAISAIVPSGSTYSVTQTSNVADGVIEYWAELR